ncbi:MAG: DUF4198 domain-containing protein, partial [Planctomycetes bacterium]|nr:DUF4198 domain-containing protein [Planctomycetota bacterium]
MSEKLSRSTRHGILNTFRSQSARKNMMPRIRSLCSAVILSLLWSQSASAHFLWLKTDTTAKPSKVQVFFGEDAEPDDPALLDKVLQAEAWVLGGRRGSEPQVLSLKKGNDSLEAELPADWQGSAVILRHTYGAMTKKDESFLLKYYAKTYPSPLPGTWRAVRDVERLPLEIVPKSEGSATVLNVTWKGAPVKGDAVTVTGPGLEKKWEGTTDDKGACRVDLPQAGLYSIRVRHIEEATGEHEGKKYQSVKHYSTLSLPYAPARLTPTSAGLAPLPEGVTSFGGAIHGDVLYVYGGNYGSAHEYSNADQSGDLWKLDLKHPLKWEQLTGGPKLQGLAMVEYKGSLYRIGGFTAMNKDGDPADLRSQPGVARFDTRKQAWEDVAPLPEGRSSHDAAVIGDTVYVVGGWNLQGQSSTSKWHETALALNLAAEKPEWKPIASPPFKRRALALGAWNGKLYCIGGM